MMTFFLVFSVFAVNHTFRLDGLLKTQILALVSDTIATLVCTTSYFVSVMSLEFQLESVVWLLLMLIVISK